ncbi:putative F-box associated interaction domain, F-box-like domain superfamily [Helianthus annuus]|nr:putative F-box associated interaction domain, F-box-like domain superfamily [Helianthus annuus]
MIVKFLPSLLILMNIIPKLPSKVVTQCKVVCKDWLVYLSTPEFAMNHCRFMRRLGDHKIIAVNRLLCDIRYVGNESPKCFLGDKVHIPFTAHPCNILFLASLDGMVCVCLINTGELVIWNPLTRVFKMLSNSNSQGFFNPNQDSLGFCVRSSGDYNIVHIKRTHMMLAINIYSLSEGSWSTPMFSNYSLFNVDVYSWSVGTFCANCLYFVLTRLWCVGNACVLRLDVDSRVISDVGFPDTMDVEATCHLVSIRDQLHMLVSIGFYSVNMKLWKLENEKWSKVFFFVHLLFLCH